ncbi:MAG: hypothetical protein V4719_12660 [Planctomycetota bacterium]
MTMVRAKSPLTASWQYRLLVVTLLSIWCLDANAAGPRVGALLRDGRRSAGILTGQSADGFQFQAVDTGTISLDQIQALELPQVSRTFPDRGWKRLTLINGDVLHAKQIPVAADQQPNAAKSTETAWFAGFENPIILPLASLAQVSQPVGTRCLIYQDFEADSMSWSNAAGGPITTSRDQARSGLHSLQCSGKEPTLRYELAEPLEAGWLEFSFFLEPELQSPGDCVAVLSLSKSQQESTIQVDLTGKEAWYEVRLPLEGNWQKQIIPRRPGWHTLTVALHPGKIRLLLDEYLLADGQFPDTATHKLSALKLAATQPAGSIWIDDFALTRSVAESPLGILDRAQDQVDLTSGDQLFGQFVALSPAAILLKANSRQAELKWPEIWGLQVAARPFVTRAVTGRIVSLEMQPWNHTSNKPSPDRLTGALTAMDTASCTLEHPLCGQMIIPWKEIQKIHPAGYGSFWGLEGRPYHFGDDVKSAYQKKTPDGTRLLHTFEVDAHPQGTAYVSLSTVDLEPAGRGTLNHPWLKRLQAGELTSELWLNDRRIAVLNTEVTGRGTASQPQRLRLKLPADAISPGKNRIEIRLNPSLGEPVQYDDWELQDWRVELDTPPAAITNGP